MSEHRWAAEPDQPHDVIEHHLGDAAPPVPPTKAIQLSLTYYSGSYKVTACNNTAQYKPGDWLTQQAVAEICALRNWQVIIVDNDIQSQILGFIKGMIPTITL